MTRRGRLGAVVLIAFGLTSLWAGTAVADHCPPIDNPDPVPGQNTTYCHTPRPTPKPPTPQPTPQPPAPTAAPRTEAPVAPRPPVVGPTRTSAPSTPAGTPFEIEVPEENALATPEIVFDGAIEDDTLFPDDRAQDAASGGSLLVGFVIGFLVGALVGRASWGVRKRRRQQIFG